MRKISNHLQHIKSSVTDIIKEKKRKNKVLVHRIWGGGETFSAADEFSVQKRPVIFHTGNVFCVVPCTTNLLLLILFSFSIDGPCVAGNRVLENSPHFVQYNTAFSTPNAAT